MTLSWAIMAFHAMTPKAVGLYREYYAEKGIFENEVYEGIPELLEELTQRNITCVLATSKPTFFATQVIEHLGLLSISHTFQVQRLMIL